jgi:transposase InsO family protein
MLRFTTLTDRGSQYTSPAYRALLAKHWLQAGVSWTGNTYDKCADGEFLAACEAELAHYFRYRSRQKGIDDIFEYMDVFHNRR